LRIGRLLQLLKSLVPPPLEKTKNPTYHSKPRFLAKQQGPTFKSYLLKITSVFSTFLDLCLIYLKKHFSLYLFHEKMRSHLFSKSFVETMASTYVLKMKQRK
jgi:hypothetical protein